MGRGGGGAYNGPRGKGEEEKTTWCESEWGGGEMDRETYFRRNGEGGRDYGKEEEGVGEGEEERRKVIIREHKTSKSG